MDYKPDTPRLVYELNEDDFDRRLECCETLLSFLHSEPDLIYRIIWSDEAIFKLNGLSIIIMLSIWQLKIQISHGSKQWKL